MFEWYILLSLTAYLVLLRFYNTRSKWSKRYSISFIVSCFFIYMTFRKSECPLEMSATERRIVVCPPLEVLCRLQNELRVAFCRSCLQGLLSHFKGTLLQTDPHLLLTAASLQVIRHHQYISSVRMRTVCRSVPCRVTRSIASLTTDLSRRCFNANRFGQQSRSV